MTTPESIGTGFAILLIDKPAGPTSHDVVGWVRWALRERSVGHCGTLDPPATGLLVVCVGTATKLVDYLTGVDKRYRARFVLGRSTSTADAEGETLAAVELPADIEARARTCVHELVGSHALPPPAVSAVRVGGRRAHEMVRAGETPELAPRPMSVHELELFGIERHPTAEGRDEVTIEAELSVTKGTYIRSLAEELGRRLGTPDQPIPAHLGSLRRTACGSLRIDDPAVVDRLEAHELPKLDGRPAKWRITVPGGAGEDAREAAAAWLRARMSPPWTRLPFVVGEPGPDTPEGTSALARLLQGQRLRADPHTLATLGLAAADGTCAVVDRAGGHLIILDTHEGRISPVRLMRFDPDAWPRESSRVVPPQH